MQKSVKSFKFMRTLHSQPLSEKGQENYDRIFGTKEKKESTTKGIPHDSPAKAE